MLTVSAEEPSINNVGMKGDGEAMMPSMPSLGKMLNKPAREKLAVGNEKKKIIKGGKRGLYLFASVDNVFRKR